MIAANKKAMKKNKWSQQEQQHQHHQHGVSDLSQSARNGHTRNILADAFETEITSKRRVAKLERRVMSYRHKDNGGDGNEETF